MELPQNGVMMRSTPKASARARAATMAASCAAVMLPLGIARLNTRPLMAEETISLPAHLAPLIQRQLIDVGIEPVGQTRRVLIDGSLQVDGFDAGDYAVYVAVDHGKCGGQIGA